eukprot:Phypoly_transcript_00839.p1 GENE.Phypoly_transcript_00839~~Phypoly_transcript_00839.p1  ORF type:complete len:778 (-),score=163.95 Phypoly_transcript_00839:79-2412(-)
MSISAAEFEALQLQLIGLKESKYESQDREKKLLNEIKALKEHAATLESEAKKADPSKAFAALSGVITKNKDKKTAALQSENEALTRNLELATQEHREQQEATMQMIKNLHATNKTLEEEIESFKKSVLEKERKIEVQEGQLRKLQIQLLQYESSADILKSDSPKPHSADGNNEEQSQQQQQEGEADQKQQQEGGHDQSAHASKLEEENLRLRENVRLLSAQLKTLDEQLTKSEESYRTQISHLEQQLATSLEKIKQDEIATARMESRLEETIEKLHKEKEALGTKIAELEEQNKKDKEVAGYTDELKDKINDLEDRLTILTTSRDEYMEQAKKITAECENIAKEKTEKEALLHELEIEAALLRKVRDEHSALLGQFENSKTVAKNLEIALDRANTECAELAEVKKEFEQVQQELANTNTHATELQAELEALKLSAEALRVESEKVAPLEQELDGLKLAHLQAVTESNTHREQYEAERQKLIDVESSLQDMSQKLNEANEQVEALNAQVSQLQTEKDDLITEHKIEERKSQRMIKELKSELQKERTSISRSVSLEQMPSVPPSPAANTNRHSPPMSPIPLTPPMPTTPRLNKQQASTVNTLPLLTSSVGNMELSASTMEELLRRDLDTALTMVGKLGEDKWKLEEKTRFLEENLALVNEDLVRKSKVIQYYVTKTKQTVTPEQLEKTNKKQSGIRGTLLRAGMHDQELSVELLTKMEAVLEETVLKNIQIQKDMETLGNATGELQTELKALKETNKQLANESQHYKDQLVRLMSNPHV